MDKPRVMPLLAGAVMAVSLTACQGMMGRHESGQSQSSAQTSSSQGSSMGAQQAMSSDLVRDVQRGLSTRGYDVGPQDGVFGDSTEQALKRFQRDQRLGASGQVDSQTLAALGIPNASTASASRGTSASRDYVPTSRRQGAMATHSSATRVGLNREQVRGVQQNLADRGYDPGRVDGRWGTRTQQALRNFQRDQNMQANGRPDPQTLAALGVESGSPATQTGQLPADNPSSVDVQQRDVTNPQAQGGILPPTGSQAPGAEPETERSTINPGGGPATRPNPPPQ